MARIPHASGWESACIMAIFWPVARPVTFAMSAARRARSWSWSCARVASDRGDPDEIVQAVIPSYRD